MKAAIAFPGLFPPVMLGDRNLVSSTLCCELPMEAVTREDSPVLAIDFPSVNPLHKPRSLLEIIARTTEVRSATIKYMLLQKADYVFRLEGMSRYRWGSYKRLPAMVQHALEETEHGLSQISEFKRPVKTQGGQKEDAGTAGQTDEDENLPLS
jgi:predicted acylesterase/phospholipase RssA